MEKNNDIEVILGLRIRYFRKEKGLSIEELAFRADIHPNYLGDIERGQRNPSIKNIEKIAQGLGVDISDLFIFSKTKNNLPSSTKKTQYKIVRKMISLFHEKSSHEQKLLTRLEKLLE